ncbi:MAG: SIS domain-containing protein [bacterium]|nr:SIS domain-containing protein [bacterium]
MKLSAQEFLADRGKRYAALGESALPAGVEPIARAVVGCLEKGGKILVFGNGGSAALAQHFSGELVGRFLGERRPLPAIALTTDTSTLTAIGNDFGFDQVFSRQIAGHGKPGDLALALTSSGNSPNLIAALDEAKKMGLVTCALSGKGGGPAAERAELAAIIPSDDTDFIQEAQKAIIHFICHRVEAAFTDGEKA